jgi:hypothetical protein
VEPRRHDSHPARSPHRPPPPPSPPSTAESEEAFERPVDRFRRTAVGGVVAAGLLGLRDALEGRPEREEIAITTDAPEPDRAAAFDVQLDPEHPERSVVTYRVPRRDDPTRDE